MAQVTRDIIQLKKSKTGDVFYPETHMQAVIGLNGNKDAKTVLAGPISGSAGPASFRPLYPTDIIPLFTKEYTYKCTANDTNNGNIYFMNVTPTSNDWATPWSVHYTLQVDCLTSEDANSKYCHGFYDIYVGSAGSNYYYHVFNTFYSGSYYPVYYHKLLYHNTEAKYTNYHITNPAKLGARIQSAWGANTRTRIYNIKVYDYKNCTISFPENIEIYGDVYRDTYYNTIDWNATSTGLQETSDQNDTTTMNLYYTRLQAGTNGIKQYSLVMQDKNGKWQSFTKGAGGTATTKEKNDAEFRLGSRIYRMGRSSDLGADEYLSNGQVQAYCGLVDLRYSLNIVSNNSATGGSVGLTQYKPVYIVGTINSNGNFILDDVWWTQDEPITEDGKIYIRVIDSVYLDNANNPNGQYRGDLISDGYAYYYKNGSFQRYVIADSANTVPWSGVTGRPSFYDLVIKASDATTLLTYKPTTSGAYQLTLNKSNIGLGNVENTALSTWTGTNKITTVGTITSGTWNGSTIAIGKGGTGLTSYTKGDMLYASANNTLAKLGANTGTKRFLSMASSVPSWEAIATSDLPAMYIGKTAVKFENTTEQALTGISTGAFSSSITVGDGSAPASNEQASTTQKRRIYFGSSNYYIEVDKNGYLHTNVGFYSDSFVSAGGLSNAGGSSGIDPDALWELLAASTSEQINSSHLPKGSAADLTSGTSTTGVTWGAKTIVDYVTNQINTSISSALYFRGQSTTAITNGGTETATINGHALVAQTGDLVLYDGKEFVWDGTHWIQFGDESSWASKNITISTSGYLTGGGDLTTNRTISINSNKISDSSSASSLSSTSTNLVTERDIYYGLPTINNSHAYTSSTSIYVPTSAGTANQVLLSGGANTAPTWGNASGLSVGTASKLGSSTVGSTTKPIYLSSGTATECNTYAGGTAVTLNGTSKAASTASFYAPTGAGTNGYVLKSNGSGEPSWVAQSTLSVGIASKLGSATVGSTNLPIYLNAGTPTEITKLLTTSLEEPVFVQSGITITTLPLVNTTAPNRLVFLPPDQIIIEQTTDGGITWVSAGTSDSQKRKLFAGNTQSGSIAIPKLNGEKSKLCGIRITITGMKYDVPANTAETDKYAYWNKDYVLSTERYTSLEGTYIWLNSGPDRIKARVYRATGANPNSWVSADSGVDMLLSGWTGGNYILLPGRTVFGGGTTQTGNYWNYRFVFFTDSKDGGDLTPGSITTGQSIDRIQGYGRNGWTLPNNLMKLNHIYDWDENQNITFPGRVSILVANENPLIIRNTATNASHSYIYFYVGSTLKGGVGHFSGLSYVADEVTKARIGVTTSGVPQYWSNTSSSTAKTLWHAGNSNLATVDWATNNLSVTGLATISGGANITGGATIKGSGNAVTNINGATATVDYAHIFITGGNNNTRPLVLQNGYGNVGIGVTQPSYKLAVGGTFNATGLSTLSGGISLGTQYTPSGASSAVDSKLVWDDTHKAWHLIGNFYADGFVSAGGMSNASGSGGVDLSAVWASLTNDPSDEYVNTKIAQTHLPAISVSGSGFVSGISYSGSGNNLVINVTKTAIPEYNLVSTSVNGLAPSFATANKADSSSSNSYYFLGWTGSTLKWYTLPANAFNDHTYTVNNGTFTLKTLVGSTTTNVSDFTANQSGTDDITFVQGTNVTLTPDATNRKITIAATDTTYQTGTAANVSGADTTAKVWTGAVLKSAIEAYNYLTTAVTSLGGKTGAITLGGGLSINSSNVLSSADTKNTAGSTDTSSKIFLIGATSQAANPQTYSDDEVYVTSGTLTTNKVQIGGTAVIVQYNSTDKCVEFIFN